ncbi:MAG: type II toxin-antitoxin system HicB family antitoxin [Patescibacteria group bacterium]|nr:type II toxin-antitoxin system HicB family antitoxin [Patescibacteria group bacterium]
MGKQANPIQKAAETVGRDATAAGEALARQARGAARERETGGPGKTTPIKVTVTIEITAYAYAEADGGYSVIVPALPGCFSEADSVEEIAANVREAAEGWLASKESFEIKGGCLP